MDDYFFRSNQVIGDGAPSPTWDSVSMKVNANETHIGLFTPYSRLTTILIPWRNTVESHVASLGDNWYCTFARPWFPDRIEVRALSKEERVIMTAACKRALVTQRPQAASPEAAATEGF